MGSIKELFGQNLKILNIGAPNFKDDLELQRQKVIQIQWAPPICGDPALLRALDDFMGSKEVEDANRLAAERIIGANPVLVGLLPAIEAIPGMTENTILHAGPPTTWDNMCGSVQGAVIGALIFEGKAANEKEARLLAGSGKIIFSPCHEHGAVGPMAGVISPAMPVHIIENKTHGNRAYCSVNEGLGKVLRFGAYDESVISRLRWIAGEFAPVLNDAVRLSGGIDTKVLIAQAVQMGDECHNRNKAATALFYKTIAGYVLKTKYPIEALERVLAFINSNDHYFLNLSMPSCKCALDAASGIDKSTVVTVMARNGVDFGIKVSGLGDRWFTAPANMVKGLLFPGFTDDDASPDLGDSAITETMGIGGFAMGASPAIVQFVGGTVSDAISYTRSMRTITVAENSNFSLPPIDFKGTATGIDILKVVETGVLPVINTGIAHKVAGVGQIGAGIVHPPAECFEQALRAYTEKYGSGPAKK